MKELPGPIQTRLDAMIAAIRRNERCQSALAQCGTARDAVDARDSEDDERAEIEAFTAAILDALKGARVPRALKVAR